MKVVVKGDGIKLKDVDSFNLRHIFECGQAFRWRADGRGYIGVVNQRVIRVVKDDEDIILENATLDDYKNIWHDYFDLGRDYSKIKQRLKKSDNKIKEPIAFGGGIRILNQDPWEILISFIISAMNNISRIGKTIDNISRRFGDPIYFEGETFYAFPRPNVLANASKEDFRSCGCGYRDKYILETAKMVAKDEIALYTLIERGYEEAFNYLLQFPGVGPKVADCICLFALKKHEAFPVDVWIKRIMEEIYHDGKEMKISEVGKMARDRFKDLAGFAQQYLFYYAREHGIGK
ncbi:MAG: 8-oxoguanine DNA glycosylase [Clostridiales bacterium]|nr:8-oxoguanine DNA glycosylase [Clostridiales bacterium]